MLQSMGSPRVGHDLATEQQHAYYPYWAVRILLLVYRQLSMEDSPWAESVYTTCFHNWELFWYESVKVLVAQLCSTLCDPMDCSPPGSSVHGISQARILEWVAISFSRGSSKPRDWTQVFHIVGRRFTVWAIPFSRGSSQPQASCIAGRFFTYEPPGKPIFWYNLYSN